MNGGREDSFLRRPTSIGSKDPHALKIPARRAEYSLTENVASPFHAEPRQFHDALAERKGRITPTQSDAFIADLSKLGIERDDEAADRALHTFLHCAEHID